MKLYEELNNFSYDIYKNYDEIKNHIKILESEEFFRRLLFNRLYYSLFHKYLDLDEELKFNTVKKHQLIKEKLKYSKNKKYYQLFIKLYNLRIWSDYQYEIDEKAMVIDLNRILNDVYNLLKIKKI